MTGSTMINSTMDSINSTMDSINSTMNTINSTADVLDHCRDSKSSFGDYFSRLHFLNQYVLPFVVCVLLAAIVFMVVKARKKFYDRCDHSKITFHGGVHGLTVEESLEPQIPPNRTQNSVVESPTRWLVMLTILAILSAPTPTAAKIQPMLCPAEMVPSIFDLSVTSACTAKPTTNATVFEANVDIYMKNLIKYTTDGWKCFKIKTTLQAWTTALACKTYERPPTHENVFVSREECQRMIEHRECNEGKLEGNAFAAMTSNTKDYPWTKGWEYGTTNVWNSDSYVNCFIVKGRFAKNFDDAMESSLGDVHACKYEDEWCSLRDKSMVNWKVNTTAIKEFVFYKTLDGHSWNNQFLSNSLEVAFTWTRNAKKIELERGKFGIITNQGLPVFIDEGQQVNYGRQFGRRHTRNVREASGLTANVLEASGMTASRVQSLDMRVEDFVDRLNNDYNSLCRQRHQMQIMDLIHSAAEPTLTARRLLNNTLVHGRLAGNFLQVRSCHVVQAFELRPMAGPHCTEYLPVNYTVSDRLHAGYVDPKTWIVSKHSPLIDCNLMDDILLRDNEDKTYIYDRQSGRVSHYRGQITRLPLYEPVGRNIFEFKMATHRPFEMYGLSNGGLSSNDYYQSFQSMEDVMRKLSGLDNFGKDHGNIQWDSVLRGLQSLSPFGSFPSINWSRIYFVWQTGCSIIVTAWVVWVFAMPRAIKNAVDHLVGISQERLRRIGSNIDWSTLRFPRDRKGKPEPETQSPTAPDSSTTTPPPPSYALAVLQCCRFRTRCCRTCRTSRRPVSWSKPCLNKF